MAATRETLRAVIYDLDGTLIDSRADLAAAVNAMLAGLGLGPLHDALVWSYVGEGAEQLVRRALAGAADTIPIEERLQQAMPLWRESYAARLLDQTAAYPGIAEVLREPPARRAVLSNKPGGFSRRILDGLGLAAAFARVIGGDEGPRKPHPGNLLALCAELSATPAEALLVGDSHIDAQTARAAGVPFCAVTWGFSDRVALEATRPDYLCDTPSELIRLLRKLGSKLET